MKGRVVSRYVCQAKRKVVAIYKRDVEEGLLAIVAASEKELGKCCRSVALITVSIYSPPVW